MGTIRVLLAEDFEPQRCFTATLLSKTSDLEVISEAGDGLEAVAQAQQFRPDIILMDIGLPKLNGFEAARQIGALVSSAKIVFLTQETDVDVVREAFNLGGWGYVLKQDAETDLLAGVAAVLAGKRFVSCGLGDNGFTSRKHDD